MRIEQDKGIMHQHRRKSPDFTQNSREELGGVADDPFESQDLKRLRMFVYLIPVFGCFPALLTLLRNQSDRQEQRVSRLVVMITAIWLGCHAGLEVGVNVTDAFTVPLLLANGAIASAYFLVMFGLMIRLWQRKPLSGLGKRR